MNEKQKAQEKQWLDYAKKHLLGRKIVDVLYMSEKDMDTFQWAQRPLVLALDDGTYLWPQSDEEGNDAGVLVGGGKKDDLLFPSL